VGSVKHLISHGIKHKGGWLGGFGKNSSHEKIEVAVGCPSPAGTTPEVKIGLGARWRSTSRKPHTRLTCLKARKRSGNKGTV